MAKQNNNYTPKVLRIHTGQNANTDWHESTKIIERQIETIQDPAEGDYRVPVTSIPSPLARIHLVEDAFKKLNFLINKDPKKLEGQTIHHKLVSETFDLAELCFNIDSFRATNNIKIIPWNVKDKLLELKSKTEATRNLAETLELYINKSPEKSNLRGFLKIPPDSNSIDNLYIITLNNQPIGCTSPSTLFFSTPNNSYFSNGIKNGSDTLFDNEFCPLHKRNKEFIKHLYLYFECFPYLKKSMTSFKEYMDLNLKEIQKEDNKLFEEINALRHLGGRQQALNELNNKYIKAVFNGPGSEIFIAKDGGEPINLYKNKGEIDFNSDFYIGDYENIGNKNSNVKNGKTPLVIQNNFHVPLNYCNSNWDHRTKVPYSNSDALDKRILPGQHITYPYLTVSDFLEPYLLKLPYKLNDVFFIGFDQSGFTDDGYALPLTKMFFEYFSVDDLNKKPGGSPVITKEKMSDDSIKVKLKVPIAKRDQFIIFERIYKTNTSPNISEDCNEGSIIEAEFNIGIMPFIKNATHKIVGLIEKEPNRIGEYTLEFYKSNSEKLKPEPDSKVRSDINKGHFARSVYYKIENEFDYLKITKGNVNAVIIPKWISSYGGRAFRFAIDFGTTNSHIEYSIDGNQSIPFDIKNNHAQRDDIQIVSYNHPESKLYSELAYYFTYELIPSKIGEQFSFPTRTALAEIHNLNWLNVPSAMCEYNPAFYFQRIKGPNQSDVVTNLKWGLSGNDSQRGEKRFTAYIELLCILMRNKVLSNQGDLNRTEFVYFYPSSMDFRTKTILKTGWRENIKKYFGNDNKKVELSESIAPYYEYIKRYPSTKPILNFDIGGGTTDICVFLNDNAKFHTSFRFAGNALFGNGYQSSKSLDNGFIKVFRPQLEKIFAQNDPAHIVIKQVFDELNNPINGSASDLLSFFFSIESNPLVKDKIGFSFTRNLQTNIDFKVAFIIFHSAIVYHAAKWLKKLGMEMPEYLFYSGNGSKTLDIADINSDYSELATLYKRIFESVYETKYPDGRNIKINKGENPKAQTCRGGIAFMNTNNLQHNSIFACDLGSKSYLINSDEKFNELNIDNKKYSDFIDSPTFKNEVVTECQEFINLILNDSNRKLLTNFGVDVSKMDKYHTTLKESLDSFLQLGITQRLETSEKDDPVTETFFFYPIIGALNRLISEIGNGK
jgi:hypothetical protein